MKSFLRVLLLILIVAVLIFVVLFVAAKLSGFDSIPQMWASLQEQLGIMWERIWG